MVKRTNAQGDDENYLYAEDGRVRKIVCTSGPILWKLVLEGGRARKLYRQDRVVLEFPEQ